MAANNLYGPSLPNFSVFRCYLLPLGAVTLYALNVPERHCKITTFSRTRKGNRKKTSDPEEEHLPVPPKQRHGGGPEDGPQGHEDHEAGVFGLMSEEHHAEPTAQSPAQARHPQQRALRDAAALALRLRLVHAVKDEAQEVDEDKVKEEEFWHIVKPSNWEDFIYTTSARSSPYICGRDWNNWPRFYNTHKDPYARIQAMLCSLPCQVRY